MSDTPRTKAATRMAFSGEYMVEIEEAQKLEHELAQSKEANAGLMRACENLERELAEVTKQRDALAEAAKALLQYRRHSPTALFESLEQALAATEGGSTSPCKGDLIDDLVNFLTVAIEDCNTQAKVYDQSNMELSKEGSLAMSTAYQITLNFINAQATEVGSHE
jgi:hypothetical protein